MLPSPHRLRKDKDFKRVYNKGRSFFVHGFGIKFFKNDLEASRLGITMPKKFFKTPQRNKIKRQIRHIFVENLDKLKPGFDILFMARKDIADYKNFEQMKSEVERVLKRLRLV